MIFVYRVATWMLCLAQYCGLLTRDVIPWGTAPFILKPWRKPTFVFGLSFSVFLCDRTITYLCCSSQLSGLPGRIVLEFRVVINFVKFAQTSRHVDRGRMMFIEDKTFHFLLLCIEYRHTIAVICQPILGISMTYNFLSFNIGIQSLPVGQ